VACVTSWPIDYGNVDPKIIWEVATVHVPDVFSVLEKFFAGQK
jgi:uncharacterized protein with HEPN domain